MNMTPAARTHNLLIQVRKCVILGLSLFLASGLFLLISHWKDAPETLFRGIFFGCVALLVLSLISVALTYRHAGRMRSRKVAEWHELFLSQREKAEESTRALYTVLLRLRRWSIVYALFLGILACCLTVSCFFAFPQVLWVNIPVFVVSFFLIYSVMTRIRFPEPKTYFAADETYIDKKEFPELYGLTVRAAENFDIDRPIRISLIHGFTAGIGEIGGVYSVQIGILLLRCFSEEELYGVLLHEFAHVKGENQAVFSHSRYNYWLQNSQLSFLPNITSFLFSAFDFSYQYHFMLFSYASGILVESEADRAMIRFGSPAAVGSGLRKLRYYAYYEWEDTARGFESFYASEEMGRNRVSLLLTDFRAVAEERKSQWDSLIPLEILARNASHPTVWMRLEALGLTDVKVLPLTPDHAPAYAAECERAEKFVEDYLYRWGADTYEESRKECYLKPLKTVEEWKAAGEPVTADGYADVVEALQSLGRMEESFALCDRAIECLSVYGARFAHYQKALQLLSRYDPAGIEHMYNALENQNFHESGAAFLGEFCCLTGNREELDRYREKAADLAQRQMDHYQQEKSLRKQDNISAETQIPPEMKQKILDRLREIGGDALEEAYLIRKTVDERFFFTAVVLHFSSGSYGEPRDLIFHKMFRLLDTLDGDWDFALFDYYEARAAADSLPESRIYTKN